MNERSKRQARRARAVGLVAAAALAALAILTGCGGGDRIADREPAAPVEPFADGASDPTDPTDPTGATRPAGASGPAPRAPLLGVETRLTGASATAHEIDLALDWRVPEAARDALGPSTRLEAVLVAPDGSTRTLARTRVPIDAPHGRVDVTLGTPVEGTLELALRGLDGVRADDPRARAAVDLPSVVAPPSTPLERLESLEVALVPGSASSTVAGNRRLHRFAVRVEGELGAGPVSVTGLEVDAGAHFRVWEDGHADPESPVRAAWRGEPIAVYLVLDASSSIALAGAEEALRDAVSRTLGALAPVATFDYRAFSDDVRGVPDLRALELDAPGSGSGTAFLRAVDTALDDVEARGEAHAVIVAFTDGRDFASRNFYPDLRSDAEVLERVAGRLRALRSARAADGAALEAHVASLGADIDVDALERVAAAGGGRHVASDDAVALGAAFAELADGLRGLYRLEYDSQRRAGDGALELEVRAGELTARVALP